MLVMADAASTLLLLRPRNREGLAFRSRDNNYEEDSMLKTVSTLTAAAVLAAFTSVFAQAPATEPAPEPEVSAPVPDAPPAPMAGEEMKGEKRKGKGENEKKGKHDNRGKHKAKGKHDDPGKHKGQAKQEEGGK